MTYTMKEAQDMCGVSRKALRYYIQENLIATTRTSKGLILDEYAIQSLQCIQYYRNVGMDVHGIKVILTHTDKVEAISVFEQTYECLQQKKMEEENYIACIDRSLDQLSVHKHGYHSFEQLCFLHENNIVIEMVMLPFRRYGGYYRLEEVAFTRSQSKWFHRLMNFCVACMFIIIIGMIIVRWRIITNL